MPLSRTRDRRGVVLLVVLFFALLLTSSIATFVRRATIDSMIVRNREAAARAEALARGGVRLAQALLLVDLVQGSAGLPLDTEQDIWALARYYPLSAGGGATLRLLVEDTSARLNLNAAIVFGEGQVLRPEVEPFLIALLEKVVEEMPIPEEEKHYDPRELAANLIDWVDADDLRRHGGPEDAYYQEQVPPYRAANRPLVTVEELRLVEGFDGRLVDALRPYVTVYPYAEGGGINPNTAPPHVLSLLFYDDGIDLRLATEDVVRQILEARQQGFFICADSSLEGCTPINEIVVNEIFPPLSFVSNVFEVVAEARVGEVRRSVEAVIDRSQPLEPQLLSWRVR